MVPCGPKRVVVTIYCDEVFRARWDDDLLGGEPQYWDYMGLLIVPVSKHEGLLRKLLNARCLNPNNEVWDACEERCRWHDDNNTDVHYSEIDDTRKFKVACSWIDVLLQNGRRDWGLIYFYILGLDYSKLDLERFGSARQQNRQITIYNRFFRTAIQKSTKAFFHDYDSILVDAVYHDKGPEEEHEYFPWHSMYRLGYEDEKLTFNCREITFLNSDHREDDGDPIHSHFIQFIDLLLGCTLNILHYTSRDEQKVKAAVRAKQLLGRIIESPNNRNSRYHYVGRQRIEFFPREDLSQHDADSIIYRAGRLRSFYTERELKIQRRIQPGLFTASQP
jgi:hypothetical protein